MIYFTDNDILKLDERYAMEGIPFHARPFHAASDILGKQFALGVGGNPRLVKLSAPMLD